MKHAILTRPLLTAALLCSMAAQAHAMDEAERARQLEVYKAQNGVSVAAPAVAATPAPATANAIGSTVPGTTSTSLVEPQAAPAVQEPVTAVATPAYVPSPTQGGTTTTVEKTTTKTYTVTKRRVGMIGNRPYPATTETVDGGETVETVVNGAQVGTQVVRPDPMIEGQQSKGGDFYSAIPESTKYYGTEGSNVRVHNRGGLNN